MLSKFIVMNDCDEGRLYNCDQCELKTFSYNYLRAHQTNKHEYEGRIFNCDQCSKSYPLEWNLEIHKRQKHNPIEIPCQHCSFVAKHKQNLSYHMKTKHKDHVNFKTCNQCQFTTLTDCALKRHEIRKHTNQFQQCKYSGCSFDTLFDEKMSAHVANVHTKTKCNYCDDEFLKKDLYYQNYSKHFDFLRKITCDLCKFHTVSLTQYSLHRNVSHQEKLICPFCEETIGMTSSFKEHLRGAKHRKFHSCDQCEFFDAQKIHLDFHKRNAHMMKLSHKKMTVPNKYRCLCAMEFTNKRFFKRHRAKCITGENDTKTTKFKKQTKEKIATPFEDTLAKSGIKFQNDIFTEPEQMLSNLNRDLKAELSYLHEILASEPKQENRISTEYSINQPCNSFNVEVVDNSHENYKEHKFKVQDPLEIPSSETDEITQDPFYVCPLNSCTFMTSLCFDRKNNLSAFLC